MVFVIDSGPRKSLIHIPYTDPEWLFSKPQPIKRITLWKQNQSRGRDTSYLRSQENIPEPKEHTKPSHSEDTKDIHSNHKIRVKMLRRTTKRNTGWLQNWSKLYHWHKNIIHGENFPVTDPLPWNTSQAVTISPEFLSALGSSRTSQETVNPKGWPGSLELYSPQGGGGRQSQAQRLGIPQSSSPISSPSVRCLESLLSCSCCYCWFFGQMEEPELTWEWRLCFCIGVGLLLAIRVLKFRHNICTLDIWKKVYSSRRSFSHAPIWCIRKNVK